MALTIMVAAACALLAGNVSAASASSNYTTQLLSSGYISLGEWQSAFDDAQTFVASLTTEEKISIIGAGDGGNFTALTFKDGSSSILDYFYVTTWPAPLAMAMTWDKDMVYAQSVGLGSELRAKGIQIANAPTAQPLGRSPYGGRNGETYGPDSYLNGIMFGSASSGIGAAGVLPAGKHFLLNEQETNRKGTDAGGKTSAGTLAQAYSAVADDKTLHETYLAPFMEAIYNGMGGVMCGMNQVNATYSCENQGLLAGFLKSELGFPGLVYGDVGAQKTGINSANAGLDYGSSSKWSNSSMQTGLTNGSLTMDRLDDMVIRNVIGWYKHNQNAADFPSLAAQGDYVDPRKNHSKLAREFAGASIVLLKNTDGALPISSPKKIAIFGYHAGSATIGPNTPMDVEGSESVYQGHMAQVGGSGQGSFAYLVTPEYALTTRAMEDGTMLRMMLNDSIIASSSSSTGGMTVSDNSTTSTTSDNSTTMTAPSGGGPGGMGGGSSYSDSTGATQTTLDYAYNQDACIVFLNAYSGEGADRSELYNADQDSLVIEVASNCNNTIVVINSNGPRIVENWIENENVTAVLYGGALGQESGNAIIDVIYGDVNPSGRLAHTIAMNETDYGVEISQEATIEFTEGNYLDWKHFDKYNITPRYEFGYGLSYTTFEYATDLTASLNSNGTALSTSPYATGARSVGGRSDMWEVVASASTSITNSGSVDGSEVAQLYISFPDAADEPIRQLRGFEKVAIAAGASADVSFDLRRKDLSIWDVDAQEWKVEGGNYTLWVGASSRDLKASAVLTI